MSECKKCIERAQTIRWLTCELNKVTQNLAAELALKKGITKETEDRIKIRGAFKIDVAKALSELQASARIKGLLK